MKPSSNYKYYLGKARRMYLQEQSFPEVYRHLIRFIDPDMAMKILDELKNSNIQEVKQFQKVG